MPSKIFNPGDIVIKSSSKDVHQWPLSADTKIAANEGEEICTREKEACNHAYSVFFASILRFQRIPSHFTLFKGEETSVYWSLGSQSLGDVEIMRAG